MDKQLLKFLLVTVVILALWQILVARFVPTEPEGEQPAAATQQAQQPAQQPAEPAEPTAQPAPEPAAVGPAPAPRAIVSTAQERLVTVQTSHWVAEFSSKGGVPVSWKLIEGPRERPITASDGSVLELIPEVGVANVGAPMRLSVAGDPAATEQLNQTVYTVGDATGAPIVDDSISIPDGETVDLVFTAPDATGTAAVVKHYRLTGGQFDYSMQIETPAVTQQLSLLLGPRIGDQSIRTEGTYSHTPPYAIVATPDGSVHNVYGKDVDPNSPYLVEGSTSWGGITDSYFALTAVSATTHPTQAVITNAKLKYNEADEKDHDFLSVALPIESGQPIHVFMGPKDREVLESVSARASQDLGRTVDLTHLINYGFFSFFVKPLIPVIDDALYYTNVLTHNYGWSIVIVTTLFNLLFFPLKYKSSVAMKRAAKYQPKMKELQAKMKKLKPTDPEFRELQKEQFDLMKQSNPLGGCLPMLLQFPFFWAFFIYFTTSFTVRQEPWIGWIRDLTAPDPYYVLPIVMCAAQIGAMRITPMPTTDDPAMKIQRQLMTWVMPIMITYFFLIVAPSGLVLYWMTLNLVGIGVQYAINRMMPPDVAGDADPNADHMSSGKKPKKPKKGKGNTEGVLLGSEKL